MPTQVTHQVSGFAYQCDHPGCRRVFHYRDEAADCERFHQRRAEREARQACDQDEQDGR